jgi:Tfp pilus assembly protein PilF
MGLIHTDGARRMVPRWRPHAAPGGAEFASSTAPEVRKIDEAPLLLRLEEWKENRTAPFAADLVGAAVVVGRPEIATDAAEDLLRGGARVSPAAKRLAAHVLGRLNPALPEADLDDEARRRRTIRRLRQTLREGPRNVLAWMDIALEYSILGEVDAAERALRVALNLAPDQRFVLRAASRFFIHNNRAEEAHELLRRSDSARHDPWVMAAEIAAADVADRNPRNAIIGRRLLESGRLVPAQTSELACALGTLEMSAGASKRAKKQFAAGLLDPTENAIAQASWAAKRIGGLAVHEHLGQIDAFEARAWASYRAKDHSKALDEIDGWQAVEPFSARPAVMGSFIAAIALEDYERAERAGTAALPANPHDPALLNNLAFAMANQGKLSEASAALARVDMGAATTSDRVAILATSGLIEYRQGSPEAGRRFYRQAIDLAQGTTLSEQRAMAILLHAREEARLGSELAPSLIAEAERAWKPLKSDSLQEALALLRRLQKISARADETGSLNRG